MCRSFNHRRDTHRPTRRSPSTGSYRGDRTNSCPWSRRTLPRSSRSSRWWRRKWSGPGSGPATRWSSAWCPERNSCPSSRRSCSSRAHCRSFPSRPTPGSRRWAPWTSDTAGCSRWRTGPPWPCRRAATALARWIDISAAPESEICRIRDIRSSPPRPGSPVRPTAGNCNSRTVCRRGSFGIPRDRRRRRSSATPRDRPANILRPRNCNRRCNRLSDSFCECTRYARRIRSGWFDRVH